MDIVIGIQLIFIVVIFVLTLICILLPLKLVPRGSQQDDSPKSARLISMCNSFSGGVFLGTCFLQLIPFIEVKFREVFAEKADAWALWVTNLSVMAGFFLSLIVEQVALLFQDRLARQSKDQDMVLMPKDYVVTLTDSSESETSEVEDSTENQSMLKHNTNRNAKQHKAKKETNGEHKTPKETKRKLTYAADTQSSGAQWKDRPSGNGTAAVAVTTGHAHDGHAHNGGHGHSHVVDLVAEKFSVRCMLLLLALSVHSLFEGIAVGLQDGVYKLVSLYVGVAVHEVLMAFAMGISLARQRMRLKNLLVLSLVYSLTIPVGIGIGMGIKDIKSFGGLVASGIIQGIAGGTFVYVIFLEILPTEINHPRDRLLKVFFMFLGLLLILTLQFLPHGD